MHVNHCPHHCKCDKTYKSLNNLSQSKLNLLNGCDTLKIWTIIL
jgi:hypothetical protein